MAPRRMTTTRAAKMTRAESIKQRFAVGKKVYVGSTVPPSREWPGVSAEMNQFFCGEELTVVDIIAHPDDPDRLALVLNTRDHGCKKNHTFSIEWLTSAEESIPVLTLAHPVKRTRRVAANVSQESVQEIRDFLKQADAKLAEMSKPAPPIAPYVPKTFHDFFPPAKTIETGEITTDDYPSPVAEVEIKPEPATTTASPAQDIGWGTAIGGALVGAFATAWAKQQRAKKAAVSAPTPFLQIEPLPAKEQVVETQTVSCPAVAR